MAGPQALEHWLIHVWLWKVAGGIVFGLAIGLGAGWLLDWAEQRGYIEETSFLAFSIALSLVTLGAASIMGLKDILSVFICGLAFGYVIGGKDRHEEENVQEAVSQLFTLPVFTLLGLVLPWEQWIELGYPGILLVLGVLLFRRLPYLLIMKPAVPALKGYKDVLFAGWFGPVGISSLYYATLSTHESGLKEVWIIASLIVFASVLVHGFSARPFIHGYKKP